MFCKECGAEVEDDTKFCPKCGKNLSDSSEPKIEKNNPSKSKSMIVALIISLIFNGLGVAYAGNIKKGVIIFVLSIFAFLISTFAGFGIFIVFWIYGLYATYIQVNRFNNKENNSSIEKIRTLSKSKKVILFIVVLIIFAVVFSSTSSSDGTTDSTASISQHIDDNNLSEEEFKASCVSIDYKQLEKNSAKYYGNHTVVSGKVLQIMEDGNGGFIRLATDGSYDDVVAVMYTGINDVVEGDTITVYGYITKDYSYESQANYHITIPCVEAKYID